jgi:hypothetical protein
MTSWPSAPERMRVSFESRSGGRELPLRAIAPSDAMRPRSDELSAQKSSTLRPGTPDGRGKGGAASSTR